MKIKDLQGKLVAVLGYGQEGKAVTSYLMKHGVTPVLFDQRPWEEWPADEQQTIKKLNVNFIFGPDAFKELAGFDLAFRSPGIKPGEVTSDKLQVTSQTKWFFEHCPAKIIGVTGTKGKGTTSSLIADILKKQYSNIYLTGNIGQTQPLEILDSLKTDDWVVYELSSFQLQDLDRSPRIGVILMVTQEHLDYHRNQTEYIAAKSAIVKFQKPGDFAVVNADFEQSMKIGKLGHGTKLFFSRFQAAAPGCYTLNGQIIATEPTGPKHDVLSTAKLQLKGEHNLENVCAAVCAAHCAGCSLDSIRQGLQQFRGLEHRLEFVGEKNAVKFYDDSFSTTPETAIAAIKSFSEPLIIILGGSSKNSDFFELGKTINEAKNIKSVILLGQEADRLESEIHKTLTPGSSAKGRGEIKTFKGAKNMAEIFEQIKSVAAPGDVVLLSPACASFGMFNNYKDRGEQFKKFVANFNI